MEHHRYGAKSESRLNQAHPDLARVAYLALKYSPYDIAITESLRTIERQRELFYAGKSTTMNSRHLPNEDGVSEAIDFLVYKDGKSTYEAGPLRKGVQAFFRAAIELGVDIESGGLWESFVDLPHIQLGRK